MSVDNFILKLESVGVCIHDSPDKQLIEIILPKINYMFFRFRYEEISKMSDETVFYIAYGLYKTGILVEKLKREKDNA